MLNGFILLSSIAGIILTVLSGLENFLLLFTGLGLVLGGIFALVVKKSSRFLFFGFVVLLAALLFGVNRINFQANSFYVDFFNSSGYDAFLCLDHTPCPADTDHLIPQMTALDLDLTQRINFILEFSPTPIIEYQETFLVDYSHDNQSVTADWLWTGDEEFIQLEPWQYLTIEELSSKEIYYKKPSFEPSFDSDLSYLFLLKLDKTGRNVFNIFVNNQPLEKIETTAEISIFAFNEPTRQIDDILLVETGPPPPFSLHYLEPGFASIYVLESDPQPIIIEGLHLTRYFGFLNRFFPFYQWNADQLLVEFTVNDGQAYVENGLLHIEPTGMHPSLQFNLTSDVIVERGLAQFQSIRLWLNIGITALALFSFAGTSLLTDRYFLTWHTWFLDMKLWITETKTRFPQDYELNRVTPFKILFFVFLALSWFLILTTPIVGLLRLLIIFVLAFASLIMIFHVLKDIEFTPK